VASAHRALERIYRPGYSYHRTGVVLSNLTLDAFLPADLFALPPDPRQQRLMKTVDHINARFGRDTVHLAATANERRWCMKQEHLSPRYTTR
jgi:DNA polymerase V